VEGCEAKGGRNCDGDGSRLCDGFVRQNSTFLGGLFTRFYDCVRVYFTITTKPLRFRRRHDFRLFFCCAHTQKKGCALSVQNFHDSLHSTRAQLQLGTIRLDFLRLSNECATAIRGFTGLGLQIQRGRKGGSVCTLKVRDLLLYAVHFSRHTGR
jgi:hypothetical protein